MQIETAAVDLRGFLVYHTSDRYFSEYISGDGLSDLSIWAGGTCVFFVLHSPAEAWIDYAARSDHLWGKLFQGKGTQQYQDLIDIPGIADQPILEIDGEKRLIRQFDPPLNSYFLADEIRLILRYFNCEPTEHPCLIMFKSLDDECCLYVDLRRWLDWEVRALQAAFKAYFGSRDFKRVVQKVNRG